MRQYNLACLYGNGKGTEKNLDKAFHWYQKAAENGNVKAQCKLAYSYIIDEGTEKDLKKAFIGAKRRRDGTFVHNIFLQHYTMKQQKESFYWYQKSSRKWTC